MRAVSIKLILLRLLSLIIIVGGLFAADYFIGGSGYFETIAIFCGIAVIQAVALNIVNGFTGQFSLGHIGFFAIGAYVSAAVATYGHFALFPHLTMDNSPVPTWKGAYPIIFLTLTSGLSAGLIGFLVGLPSLRLRGDYLAIITLGFAQIVQVILRNIKAVNGSTIFSGIELHGQSVSTPHLTTFFWVGIAAVIVIWVSYGIRFSIHGLAFLSVRDDEIAAEAMGINTTRYKVTAFVLSAFFTGVAGALFALYSSSLSNDQFSFIRSIDVVVMVVLGGLGSISGSVIAAIALSGLPEFLRSIDQYRMVIYPLLLILLMLSRPQGIFGREELSRAWLAGQVKAVKNWFTRPSKKKAVSNAGEGI